MKTLIHNAAIVNEGRIFVGSVLIEDDKIAEISEKSEYSAPSENSEKRVSLMEYFGSEDIVWTQSLMMAAEQMEKFLADTRKEYESRLADKEHPIAGTLPKPEEMSCPANEFLHSLLEWSSRPRANRSQPSTSSSTC